MWAWYGKGLPEWHMLWGNNVFSYDQALRVRGLGRVSHSLAQLEGIYLGVHPKIKLMVNDGNRLRAKSLLQLRLRLEIVGWTMLASMLALLFSLIAWSRARRRFSAAGACQGVTVNGA